ncbi:MAG: C1 family peptidase [archaeon]
MGRWQICLLLGIVFLFLCSSAYALKNPAAVYCNELGYTYEVASGENGEHGFCAVSDDVKFEAWDFIQGKVGGDYSYCSKLGYATEYELVENETYSMGQAVCVEKMGFGSNEVSEAAEFRVPMLDLMEQNNLSVLVEDMGKASHQESAAMIPAELFGLKEMAKTGIPAGFDWRNKSGHSYIGPIKDQGSCGSCYAFSSAASAEGVYNWANGLYDGSASNFSESFIIWCLARIPAYSAHFYGCDGADYDYMELQALVTNGTTNNSNFPYTESDPGSCTHWGDSVVKFNTWGRIPCSDVDSIKAAIMTYGVIDAAVYVDSNFQAYTGGIYNDSLTSCSSSPCYYTSTNHAIALVGWGYNDTYGDYWILRNSWGSDWGESGYMRIAANAARVACEATYLSYAPLWNSSGNITSTVAVVNQNQALSSNILISSGGTLDMTNSTLNLNGNTIYIQPGGTLLLQNSTLIANNIVSNGSVLIDPSTVWLNGNWTISAGQTNITDGSTVRVNVSTNGTYGIRVQSGGALVVNDSNITNGDTGGARYFFIAESGSNFSMADSHVSYAGWADSIGSRGLEINTTAAEFRNNTLRNGYTGAAFYSNGSTIVNNTVSSNAYGLYVESSLNNYTNNTVLNNTIGFQILGGSSSNVLSWNNLSGNAIGINLSSSPNNSIYNNYFNNTQNALDDNTNFWNASKASGTSIMGGSYIGGNYWSDYAGLDYTGDGLGDTSTPYTASGSIQNGGDYLPLAETSNYPQDLQALLAPDNESVNLSWTPAYNAEGYYIYYNTNASLVLTESNLNSSNVWVNLSGQLNSSYSDSNASHNSSRYYRVASYNGSNLNFSTNTLGKFNISVVAANLSDVKMNLISLPSTLSNYSISNVIRATPSENTVVAFYNASSSPPAYQTAFYFNNSWRGDFTELQPQVGFAVTNTQGFNFTVVGTVPTGQQNVTIYATSSTPGLAEVNTIGWYSAVSECGLNATLNETEMSSGDTVSWYNTTSKDFETITHDGTGWNGDFACLEPGVGYFFTANQSYNLTYNST